MAKKISSDVRFYYGGYDPGTAALSVSVSLEGEPLDTTSITDAAERVLPGIRKDKVEFSGLFDDGADSFDKGVGQVGGNNNVVTLFIGTAVGDRAYCGTAMLKSQKAPAAIADLVKHEAEFAADRAFDRCQVMMAKTSSTGTLLGSTLDNGGSSLNGGVLYAHVFSYTGTGTLKVVLDDAPDGVTWTNKAAAVGFNGPDSQRLAFTGTLARYTRVSGVPANAGDVFSIAGVVLRS